MERRGFIWNTLGLGLVAFPGIDILDPNRLQVLSDSLLNTSSESALKNINNIVVRGDIIRNLPPSAVKDPWIPLYQGNGRFGSCFGPFGLHAAPDKKIEYRNLGSTGLTHIKHNIRAKFNADYLIPIGTIYWETEPQEIKDYEQYQSFFDGMVTTRFTTIDYAITVISWFDSIKKDIACFQIDVKGKCPDIIISSPRLLTVHYNQQIVSSVEEKLEKDLWQADIKCLNASSTMKARSNAQMKQVKEGLKLSIKPGRNNILIAINSDIIVSADQSLHQTKTWWHTTWKNSGWLDLPDETTQKVWVRSLAYTLYSHNDDGFGCTPPTGLVGNGWPFDFPFDSSCMHLLLLMTGQTNIARKWIEFYYSRFDGLKDYTKRIFKSEGIFLPHVFPYGQAYNYHYPEVPNRFYYPIYNSAILIRLVDQTAVMVNDPQWTMDFAVPLINEATKFYLSNLKKGNDGLWHLHLIPSIGLDESGANNQPDYISGLFAAQYALQKGIEYELDNDHRMQSILSDGFAYKPSENGMYPNNFGLEAKDFGKQKHPDQLFPLTHIPLELPLSEPSKKAHELRYEITDGAKIPSFLGHTGGEFILSSSRIHNAEAFRKDWDMMLPAEYTDPEYIQYYESSGKNLAYYVTTHGLVAQAILETIVSTWWGQLDLGSCIPWKGTVRFGNIRTLLGVTVSGEIENGNGQAVLEAWKDTKFKFQAKTITPNKGQKMIVKIKQGDKKI